MSKKRKTRQEKIILQLKRELKQQRTQKDKNFKLSQEAISPPVEKQFEPKKKRKITSKKSDNSTLSYHPNLIKKDLARTLILTLIILSLEFVLYLKLR